MRTWRFSGTRPGWLALLAMVLVLFMLTVACGGTTDTAATSTTAPTDTVVVPSDTPVPPTDTPIPPTATPNLEATQAMVETAAAEVVMGEIEAILKKTNSPAGDGHLVFVSPDPYSITVDGHDAVRNEMIPVEDEVANFAFHSKITWTSKLGFSGCGFSYRITDGLFNTGEYYQFYYNRLSGAPYYLVNSYEAGTWMRRVGDGFSNLIKEENGEENELLFIAKKNEFQVFFNGKRVNVFYDGSIVKGLFAYFIYTNSGEAECVYEDTWIWSWDK